MSLIGFHKFLIATAILFSLGFALRQFSEFRAAGDAWLLVEAVGLTVAAAALGYYLAHLRAALRLPNRPAAPGTTRSRSQASVAATLARAGASGGPTEGAERPSVNWAGGTGARTDPASGGSPDLPQAKSNGRHGGNDGG